MAIDTTVPKQISQAGREFLQNMEGVRIKPYKDSRGIWTCGVGHRMLDDAFAYIDLVLSTQQIAALLNFDLRPVETAINKALPTIKQNEFDALCSFVINVGVQAFKDSTLLRRAQKGDIAGAADEILRWVKQPELAGRRIKERDFFLGKKTSS